MQKIDTETEQNGTAVWSKIIKLTRKMNTINTLAQSTTK